MVGFIGRDNRMTIKYSIRWVGFNETAPSWEKANLDAMKISQRWPNIDIEIWAADTLAITYRDGRVKEMPRPRSHKKKGS